MPFITWYLDNYEIFCATLIDLEYLQLLLLLFYFSNMTRRLREAKLGSIWLGGRSKSEI
jgi:hypothetical protein